MIRLSKLADYSFLLLNQIVNSNQEAWAASELAEKTTIPLPTTSKVLKLLAKSGIVVAQRGAMGGYRLARSATDISVADIVEAVDGPITLTGCIGETSTHCIASPVCGMRRGWKKINSSMRQALASVSLAEIVENSFPDFGEVAS